MNKKLFIFPLLALLLISSVFAFLTFDHEETDAVSGSIQGLTVFNNTLLVSSSTGVQRLTILDTSYNIVSERTDVLNGVIASDNTQYLYVKNGLVNQIRRYDILNNYSYVDAKTFSNQAFTMEYIDGKLWIGNVLSEDGEDDKPRIQIFNYETGVIEETLYYDDILGTNTITHVAEYGSNVYIGYGYNLSRINKQYNVIEEPIEILNLPSEPSYTWRELTFFNGEMVLYTTYSADANHLFVFTPDIELTSEYVVLNGVYYSDNQCLDTGSIVGGLSKKYVLCNSSTMQQFTNSVVAYCDGPQYETICSGECLTNTQTINGSVYVTGYCDASDCSNECLTVGSSKSVGLTSYQICGQYNTNICLEYSGTFTCPSGEVYDSSSATYCTPYVYDNSTPLYLNDEWYVSINSESSVLTTETVSNTGFINTYLQITKGITANFNPFIKNVYYWDFQSMQEANAVKTVNQIGVIDFGTFYRDSVGGNGFVSYDCESNYNNLVYSGEDTVTNTTYTLTNSLSGLVNTVSVAITPTINTTTVFNYYISRISPSIEETTTFTITNTNLLIVNDGVTLLNQTFASDIQQIFIYSDIDFSNGFIGHKFLILESSGQENIFYTNPKSFTGTPVPASNQISFSTNETITFNGYSVSYSNTQRDGFESITMNTFFGSCLLNNNQNQILRVYYNDENIPSYIDFKDVFLNVNIGTGVIGLDADNTLLGRFDSNLNIKQKYLLAIFTSIALFILVLFMTSNFELNSTSSSIIGVVAGVCTFLFFVIIGWLPVYVAIVSFIIAGGVGAVFIRRQVVGV